MRVTIHLANDKHVILKIAGRIAGEHVPVLHKAWQELAPSLGERRLLVDLRDVMHVDEPGRSLLADMHAQTGAEFVADTPLTKHFAEQAQQYGRRDSNPEK
jgi:anti-anti-sigma regulatory factor